MVEQDNAQSPESAHDDDSDTVIPPHFEDEVAQQPAEPTASEGGNEDDDEYEETPVTSHVIDPLDQFRDFKRTDSEVRQLPPLNLLFGTIRDTVAKLSNQANGEFQNPQDQSKWIEAVEDAYGNYYRTGNALDRFETTVTAGSREWTQKIQVDDAALASRSQRLPVTGGELLTGEDALNRVTSAIGMGAVIQVPLWHSGIWFSVKAADDVDLYELERQIAQEKVSLGRMTKGLVFSNTSVYIVGHLVNFIMRHVYSTTAPNDNPETLKKIIRVTDLPAIIWAMVTATYPGGYPYRQPCVADLTKCTHVVEAMIDLGKLLWVDRTSLSDKQKRMMAMRNSRTRQELIDEYQNEFDLVTEGRVRKLNEQVSIELCTPNIEQYENSGYSWVETIVRNTDEAFGQTLIGKERNDHISDVARTTAGRQYSHWVKAIEITDAKGITTRIEERASIEASIVRISSKESIKATFLKAIGEYIDAVTIAIVGYVNYACPKCGALQMKANGPKSRIVPLDMMSVFLTLQRHKIDQALKDLNAI